MSRHNLFDKVTNNIPYQCSGLVGNELFDELKEAIADKTDST